MSSPKGPFVVACSLLVAGIATLVAVDTLMVRQHTGDGQEAFAQIIEAAPAIAQLIDEAQLAAIEPAAGHAEPKTEEAKPETTEAEKPAEDEKAAEGGAGEHEPKKSFTGKVLSIQEGAVSITLGRLKVETSKELKANAEAAFTPTSLRTPEITELLKRRFKFTPYAHDAVRGTPNAPMTMVEFSDLSCVACMDDLKKADDLFDKNIATLRYIQVYLPVDRANQTNVAAFYGKVAQRGGKFWEFRKALFDLKDPAPEAYFDALVTAGVPAVDARRWLTTEARRFYRELDADAQLSRALGLDKPPHFFINGIHVGDGGIPRVQLADVLGYEQNYTHYQLDSLAHD